VLTERTDTMMFGSAPASFWVCGRFEVRDGKITHWRDYYDNGNILVAFVTAAVRAAAGRVLPSRRAAR
jgi:limonene-1,2-epoxide hydrolase